VWGCLRESRRKKKNVGCANVGEGSDEEPLKRGGGTTKGAPFPIPSWRVEIGEGIPEAKIEGNLNCQNEHFVPIAQGEYRGKLSNDFHWNLLIRPETPE